MVEIDIDRSLMTITLYGEEYECKLNFTYESGELTEQTAALALNSAGVSLIFSCKFMIDSCNDNVEIIAPGMDGCGNRCDCCESSHYLTIKLPNGRLKQALTELGWSQDP